MNRLGMAKGDILPLHLHLTEINLDRTFKKQKTIIKHTVPILNYFTETLKKLDLKLYQ